MVSFWPYLLAYKKVGTGFIAQGHDVHSTRPRHTRWLRWTGWLLASVLLAVGAQTWQQLGHADWAVFVWVLPLVIVVSVLLGALWQLLGSRRTLGPSATPRSRTQSRRIPRNPQLHLRDMRRSGEYWAVMLRLPVDGSCDHARSLRTHAFDLYRAPPLPLKHCPNKRCRCGYSGLRERRRRDVLPPNLARDRRAGAVIAWPEGLGRHTRQPPDDASEQRAATLLQALRS